MRTQRLPLSGPNRARAWASLAATILVLLAAPASASAQIPLIQYGVKRIFKEFGRGVRVRSFMLKTPGGELARYDRIEVAPFENEILELMPYQMNEALAAEIVRRLQKEKLFVEVVLQSSTSSPASSPGEATLETSGAESEPRTLLLTGTVRDFYPGHEALRALNMGLRGLYVIVQVRLQDKATGEELYREQIAVDVKQVHGDAYKTSVKAVAKEVAKRLKEAPKLPPPSDQEPAMAKQEPPSGARAVQ
ncbi:MAG: hypothetical protein V3R29_09090 [Candidatus Acidoferrales bacterium]